LYSQSTFSLEHLPIAPVKLALISSSSFFLTTGPAAKEDYTIRKSTEPTAEKCNSCIPTVTVCTGAGFIMVLVYPFIM
jgi:hypothetical protein